MLQSLCRRRKAACFLLVAIVAVISSQFAISMRGLDNPKETMRSSIPSKGSNYFSVLRHVPIKGTEVCKEVDNDNCLEQAALQMSRIWKKRSWISWCNSKSPSGLVLVKVPKSASSTLAGVVLRIQHRHNCNVQWKHQLAREYPWRWKDEEQSEPQSHHDTTMRVAPIRDPTARALSSFFFHHVSFHGRRHAPSDDFVIQHLKQAPHNYILDYTAPSNETLAPLQETKNPTTKTTTDWNAIVQAVQEVIDFYDFLFVVDRLDESLVVWAWLTDLPLTDLVLVQSSKQAGSWYSSGKRCFALAKPVQSPAVQTFLRSKEWKQGHAADQLLYVVAHASLDRTIQQVMGRDRLEQDLRRFQDLKTQVQDACSNETYFPCSSTGVPQLEKSRQSCYVRDFGCGYPCVDRFVAKMKISSHG